MIETEVDWTQTLLRRSLAKLIDVKTIVFVLYLSVDVFSIKVISFFFSKMKFFLYFVECLFPGFQIDANFIF